MGKHAEGIDRFIEGVVAHQRQGQAAASDRMAIVCLEIEARGFVGVGVDRIGTDDGDRTARVSLDQRTEDLVSGETLGQHLVEACRADRAFDVDRIIVE